MSGENPARDEDTRALAAAWLARIRADNARSADRAGFQAWLDEDPRHREAFTAVAAMWETAGGLDRHAGVTMLRSRRRTMAARAAALAVALVLGLAGTLYFRADEAPALTYVTGIGEQLRVPLPDGSAAVLDTDTAIRVEFHPATRDIELLRGRAHIDVVHDPEHPFIVHAGSRQVVALGTAFNVARVEEGFEVVLINGRVLVESTQTPDVTLDAPGEFANLGAGGEMRQGRASLERETAWQIGKIVFDDEPLSSAVAQMNRYSRRPLVLADPAVGQLRISGIYGIGNIDAFATSVAILWPVEVTFQRERVLLAHKK